MPAREGCACEVRSRGGRRRDAVVEGKPRKATAHSSYVGRLDRIERVGPAVGVDTVKDSRRDVHGGDGDTRGCEGCLQ